MDPNGGTSTRDIPLQVMDPKLYAQAAMLAPQAMTMATGNAIVTAPFPQGSTNTGATMTYASKSLGIVYRDYLHDHYKYVRCLDPGSSCWSGGRAVGLFTCDCLCDFIYFDSHILPRSYQAVYENRIELNYPYHAGCGCCIVDEVTTKFFDQSKDIQHATSCTPHHMCYIFSWTGGVLSEAPCAAVNCCLCSCCLTYYTSVRDPKTFVQNYNDARTAFLDDKRLVPAYHPPGPTAGKNAK